MNQLPLDIQERIPYEPNQFIMHGGVASIYDELLALMNRNEFRIAFVHGDSRTGKTHLSLKLADDLIGRGRVPHLYEADAQGSFLTRPNIATLGHQDVFLIDNAELYLNTLLPGNSGAMVRFIEELRVASAAVIFFSSTPLSDLSADEHVLSRFIPGQGFTIRDPWPQDMPELLEAMARQRGRSLTERKITFLEKRLPRSFAAMEHYLERLGYLSRLSGKPATLSILGKAI